jgi:hypothetical protein
LIYDAIRDNILERWWSGQMFEIGILCVIAIAIGYCATLWIMGRRGDVIYGQFIQTEQFPAATGLDAIADALKAKGIHAEVAGHLQWKAAADEILRERAGGKTDAIVLVGHSQGANNVIDMARVLEAQNVPVALLVTLAPYRQDPVPANVMRAINYYQSAGWGAPLTAGPGFRGKLSNVDVAEDSTVSHINIDKSARIQAEIAREIGAVAKAK